MSGFLGKLFGLKPAVAPQESKQGPTSNSKPSAPSANTRSSATKVLKFIREQDVWLPEYHFVDPELSLLWERVADNTADQVCLSYKPLSPLTLDGTP